MDEKNTSTRQMIIGIAAYTSASILGPLIIFGAFGWFLDYRFGSRPIWTLVNLGVAFVITNVFLVRKARKLNKKMEEYGKSAKKKLNEKENRTKDCSNSNSEEDD